MFGPGLFISFLFFSCFRVLFGLSSVGSYSSAIYCICCCLKKRRWNWGGISYKSNTLRNVMLMYRKQSTYVLRIFGQHTIRAMESPISGSGGMIDQSFCVLKGWKESKIQPSFGTFPYTVQVTWADCKCHLLFTLWVRCCLSMAMVRVMEISLFTEIRLGFVSLVQQWYGSWIWIKTEFKINGHLYSKYQSLLKRFAKLMYP